MIAFLILISALTQSVATNSPEFAVSIDEIQALDNVAEKVFENPSVLPGIKAHPEAPQALAVALLVLLESHDSESGAVVPVQRNSRAMDMRDAGWYLLAFNQCGLMEIASATAEFLAERIRLRENAYGPRGSVSAAIAVDGQPASPFFEWDIAATAYVLAALRTHAAFLDDDAQSEFIVRHRTAIEAGGDILANWTLGGSGEIAPAYVAEFGHDGVTATMYFEFWMGIEAARQCLELASVEIPRSWTNRQRELMSRIKFQRINRGVPAKLSWNLGQWFQRISNWDAGELGLYIANSAGVPAPEGFAWNIEALVDEARLRQHPHDPLAAATALVGLIEYLRLPPPATVPTP